MVGTRSWYLSPKVLIWVLSFAQPREGTGIKMVWVDSNHLLVLSVRLVARMEVVCSIVDDMTLLPVVGKKSLLVLRLLLEC